SKIRELFRLDFVTYLVRTCTKRLPNHDRIIIWLIMMALTLIVICNGTFHNENIVQFFFYMIIATDDNGSYLLVRNQFQWTLKDYTVFNVTHIIVQLRQYYWNARLTKSKRCRA
uniref:Uncharacterized protein n=1 Tax=Glossina palpalis gambiensis TaxID=67801 RepID=A0A1B0BG53_9MUSC